MQGKHRVCCFDPSGYYSNSLNPPREAKQGPPSPFSRTC